MDFMDDLENDPQYRQNVNIYKRKHDTLAPVQETDDEDDERPKISLEEMLDDLVLDDAEMEDAEGGGEDGGDMD
jgi:nonsense-mediated mRNA decay protein 3